MCNQMILSIKLSEIRYVIIEDFYGREKSDSMWSLML